MRNLKKALSLALALVMMLGMLTVASAADEKVVLADLDAVENKEAVTLLVDLGIIAGIVENGATNFKPADSIDRNSFAKMVYYILMGNTPEASFVGVGTLNDVSGTWAEGFVNYLNSVKIVSGDDKANFNGTNKVTVAQAAKMLLVALGYNAIDRGYEADANWSINIMKDAQANGLMNNVLQVAAQELTRDNAAQMIYNALFATTVTAKFLRDSGEKYVAEYTYNPTTLGLEVYGLVKATLFIGDVNEGAIAWSLSPAEQTPTGLLSSAIKSEINNAYTFGPDTVGGSAVIYVKAGYTISGNKIDRYTYRSLISGAALVGEDNIVSTTYGNRTINELMGANGNGSTTNPGKHTAYVAAPRLATGVGGALETAVKVYVNGEKGTLTGTVNPTDASVTDVKLTALEGTPNNALARGDIVELIADDNGDIAVVRITRKTVRTLNAAPETRTASGVNQVRISSIFSGWEKASNVVGYEDLKSGDVVLFAKIGNVYHIEKANVLETELGNKINNGSVVLTGDTYVTSQLSGASAGGKWHTSNVGGTTVVDMQNGLKYNVTYAVYLDNGKNIIDYDPITEDTSSNYAYVLQTGYVEGGSLGASEYAQARLLFGDGTTEIVTVGAAYPATGSTAHSLTAGTWKSSGGDTSDLFLGHWVNFRVASNGKYTLTQLANETGMTSTGTESFSKGAAKIGAHPVNANTVFIRQTKGANDVAVFTVYKGNNNMPSFEGNAVAAADFAVAMNGNFAAYVLVTGGQISGSAGQYVYVADTTYSYDADGNFVLDNVYVNGELQDGGMKFAQDPNTKKGGLYIVKSVNDGVYTLDTDKGNLLDDDGLNLANIKAFAGNVIQLDYVSPNVQGNNAPANSYNVDNDTKVFVIDADLSFSNGSIGSIRKTGTDSAFEAFVVTNSAGTYATQIYLVYSDYDIDSSNNTPATP